MSDFTVLNHNKIKILDMIFNTKMNYIQPFKYLKTYINKRLNIMKVINHTINFHKHLIRFKFDYGSIIYNSAEHKHKTSFMGISFKSDRMYDKKSDRSYSRPKTS